MIPVIQQWYIRKSFALHLGQVLFQDPEIRDADVSNVSDTDVHNPNASPRNPDSPVIDAIDALEPEPVEPGGDEQQDDGSDVDDLKAVVHM